MSDDLDLRGIDHRHEPDPQFRAALQRRVAAIVAGTDPGSVTEARDLATIDLEPTSAKSAPKRNRRRVVAAILAAAAVVVAIARRGDPRRRRDASRPTVPDRDRAPDDASATAAQRAAASQLAPGDVLRRRGRRNTDAADLRHPRRRVGGDQSTGGASPRETTTGRLTKW